MAMSANAPLFEGIVETTLDALRLIEAARRGIIPRVIRRLNDLERRTMIKSGAVFVFSVEESGIKRWTEGLAWSQSRISGNFLLYREISDRNARTSTQSLADGAEPHYPRQMAEPQLGYKPRGLMKKTVTVKIDGSDYHLISYYTQDDLASGRLQRPTTRPDIMAIEIPPELTRSTNFRYPPNLEESQERGASGSPQGSAAREADAMDYQYLPRAAASPRTASRVAPQPAAQATGYSRDMASPYYRPASRGDSVRTSPSASPRVPHARRPAQAQGHTLPGWPTASPSSYTDASASVYNQGEWMAPATGGSSPTLSGWSGSPQGSPTVLSAPGVPFSFAGSLPARERGHGRAGSYPPAGQWPAAGSTSGAYQQQQQGGYDAFEGAYGDGAAHGGQQYPYGR